MTGFSSLSGQSDGRDWSWEMRSVNGRGLDIRVRLPDQCERLEAGVRQAVSGVCARGRVSVSLNVGDRANAPGLPARPDDVDAALDAAQMIADAAAAKDIRLANSSPADILTIASFVQDQRERRVGASELVMALEETIGEVVGSWDESRSSEGRSIKRVLDEQLRAVKALASKAKKAVNAARSNAKDRLRDEVTRLLAVGDDLDEDRIAMELALLAVKSDVSEEVDRIETHALAMRQLLEAGGVVGRRLDFLTQELNREANTLCSKAVPSELKAVGLELKIEVDRMREQVQNIE